MINLKRERRSISLLRTETCWHLINIKCQQRHYIGFPSYLTVLLASDFYYIFLCCRTLHSIFGANRYCVISYFLYIRGCLLEIQNKWMKFCSTMKKKLFTLLLLRAKWDQISFRGWLQWNDPLKHVNKSERDINTNMLKATM